jgi:hypothetical protein
MSALGQKQTLRDVRMMSALPPKADMRGHLLDVCFVPIADIGSFRTRLTPNTTVETFASSSRVFSITPGSCPSIFIGQMGCSIASTRFTKINSDVTAIWTRAFVRHEALRAREQQFLGLRIRESCCECTGSKFQEYWQTVFGFNNNG